MSDLISSIDYRFKSYLFDDPIKYLTEIQGDVIAIDHNDQEVIGAKVKYYLLNLEDNEYGNANDLLDLYSNTSAFIGHIYKKDGSFKTCIQNLSEYELYNSNILILDRIEILPSFRGKGLTKIIIENGIQHFGTNVSLLALKSFPLQFEYHLSEEAPSEWQSEMEIQRLNQNEREASIQLTRYYKSLGFIKLRGDNIMIKILL